MKPWRGSRELVHRRLCAWPTLRKGSRYWAESCNDNCPDSLRRHVRSEPVRAMHPEPKHDLHGPRARDEAAAPSKPIRELDRCRTARFSEGLQRSTPSARPSLSPTGASSLPSGAQRPSSAKLARPLINDKNGRVWGECTKCKGRAHACIFKVLRHTLCRHWCNLGFPGPAIAEVQLSSIGLKKFKRSLLSQLSQLPLRAKPSTSHWPGRPMPEETHPEGSAKHSL